MTALTPEEIDVLKRLLAALGDAGKEFIIAGGQAARLFRFHPLAQPLTWQPILTNDIDVATMDKGHRATRRWWSART